MITNNSSETKKLGHKFTKKLKPGNVVLLYGDLGAGKTTFVQAIAKGLGIKDRILSPTFVLQRSYKIEDSSIRYLNHIDLYRIEDPKDAKELGLSELISDKESITIIEWADRLKNLNPKMGFEIYFKYKGENEREIEIKKI